MRSSMRAFLNSGGVEGEGWRGLCGLEERWQRVICSVMSWKICEERKKKTALWDGGSADRASILRPRHGRDSVWGWIGLCGDCAEGDVIVGGRLRGQAACVWVETAMFVDGVTEHDGRRQARAEQSTGRENGTEVENAAVNK